MQTHLDDKEAEQVVAALKAFDYPKASDVELECDMVMKGGITSGVVYPLAVCELAKRYRLRSVGGTSAGAIAAAVAAAAEVGRDKGGFRKLAGLPNEIGPNLGSMFVPSPGTRPLFRVLLAVDYSRADDADKLPVRCWFSDGGISSNFPIHFFDAMWPGRPTFGIDLAPYHPDHTDSDAYLPPPRARGKLPRLRDTTKFTGFIRSIADVMQNWADEGQSMLPGFRERIVAIHHTKQEGGINLSMPSDLVLKLAARGWLAATQFENFSFPQHRWTRYRIAMSELQQAVDGMRRKYTAPLGDGEPGYRPFVAAPGPDVQRYRKGERWRAEAVIRTDELMEFAPRPPNFESGAPRPDGDLRITPRF